MLRVHRSVAVAVLVALSLLAPVVTVPASAQQPAGRAGPAVTQVPPDRGGAPGPASPTAARAGGGGWVAGWSYASDGTSLVMLIDPDTGEQQRFAPVVAEQELGGFPEADLEWRPDGLRLTTTAQQWGTGAGQLVEIDPQTGQTQLLLQLPDGMRIDDFSWSPLGDQVALTVSLGAQDGPHVMVATLGSEALVDLGPGVEVDWSPTGDQLAFIGPDQVQGQPGNRGDLWLVHPDGTDRHNLSGGDASVLRPEWSPDGDQILVTMALMDAQGYGVHLFDADTGSSRRISLASGTHSRASWSPDGKRILHHYFDGAAETRVAYLPSFDYDVLHSGQNFVPTAWQPDPTCLLAPEARTTSTLLPAAGRRADEGDLEIGAWVVRGCFRKSGDKFVTRDAVLVSGMTLTPVKGAIQLDRSARRLTSTGPVVVSVDGKLEGRRSEVVRLDRGRVEWDLSKTTRRFDVDHFLHLPVRRGHLVVKATGGGHGQLAAELRLPRVLGVVPAATRPFAISNEVGIDTGALELRTDGVVPVTHFLGIRARVSFDPETRAWETSATASHGDTSVDVGFRYDRGILRAAHVSVPRLDLAGLMTVTDFSVRYDRRRSDEGREAETYAVSAAAPFGDAGLSDSIAGEVRYVGEQMTSFALEAATAHFFGAVRLSRLRLAWSREDGWSGAAGAVVREDETRGARVVVELRSVKHRVVHGELAMPLALLDGTGGLQVTGVHLTYDETQLSTGRTQTTWSGGGKVRLPGPDAPAVGADLTFVDGAFASGRLEADDVQLAAAVRLTALSLALGLHPLALAGSATVRLGPEIPVLGAATAQVTAAFAQGPDGQPDVYRFSGDLTLDDGAMAGASITYRTDDVLMVNGSFLWRLGDVAATASQVSGTITQKGYLVEGNAVIGLGQAELPGRIRITQAGLSGCVGVPGTTLAVGYGYRWNGPLHRFRASCDFERFLPAPVTRGSRRSAAAGVELPVGQEATVLALVGDGAPLTGALHGPDGLRVDLAASDGLQGEVLVHRDAASRTTYVVVPHPAGGEWTVDPRGGPGLLEASTALPAPDPVVEVRVDRAGDGWVLHHLLVEDPDVEVALAEVVEGVHHPIATVTGDGTTSFEPTVGPGGPRQVVATVISEGLARRSDVVTTYDAPVVVGCTRAAPCPTTLAASRRTDRRRLVVTGRVGPDVDGGPVLVELVRGRRSPMVLRVAELRAGRFRAWLPVRPRTGPCRIRVGYPGSEIRLPSSTVLRARC